MIQDDIYLLDVCRARLDFLRAAKPKIVNMACAATASEAETGAIRIFGVARCTS